MIDIILDYLEDADSMVYYECGKKLFEVNLLCPKDGCYDPLPICTTSEESFAKFICDMFNGTFGRAVTDD